jgi:hydrogenase expression/formation protein HypC
MCLSVPAKVISIDGDIGKVSVGGSIIEIGLQLVENVKVGDYVLVHTGFALEKINADEAVETLKMLEELRINGESEPE